MKQASQSFFEMVRDVLLGEGFEQDKTDCCLFKRGNVLVGVYVDDLLVVGTLKGVENAKV